MLTFDSVMDSLEIQESLNRTGLLLASLEAQQQERLGQQASNSQLPPPPPSQHEVETGQSHYADLGDNRPLISLLFFYAPLQPVISFLDSHLLHLK